ncbi:VLRF1 family aeRF1-type release factor [Nitriliruptor alkaliphilus]|uniref:VLRF1 family aeRF1-type release factor n=1 Tax=Nitriliruptor alkaliphilus TaxID=427918 RepID=UPI00069774CA|nr:VLRF1 family aeRF1-type release factor [Nitriliruptor alkaliphilus]
MILDDERIRDLLRFDDESGVLSFYVGITPDRAADPQPTAPLELRSRIKALKADLEGRDPDLAKRVESRLAALGPELDRLVDPHAHGRGRALFAGVASGRTETVSLQIPFADRVVHHEGVYVRPLVAAHDEGRAAGILNVGRDSVRVLSWSVGEVEEVASSLFEVEDDVMARDKSAPSVGNVGHPWQGRADRDSFEARLDENLHRYLKTVVDEVMDLVAQHGWDRVVVAGNAKLRDEVAAMVRDADTKGVRVLVAEDTFDTTAPHEVAERVWPLLRSVHRQREADLVDLAIDRGLGGNQGAVGMRRVCDALNEGRVRHLVYASDLQVEGYRSSEDTLHPRVEGVVAGSDQLSLTREPLFVERLVEKAIATGATVTPVEDGEAGPLQAHEGVGALLRW